MSSLTQNATEACRGFEALLVNQEALHKRGVNTQQQDARLPGARHPHATNNWQRCQETKLVSGLEQEGRGGCTQARPPDYTAVEARVCTTTQH